MSGALQITYAGERSKTVRKFVFMFQSGVTANLRGRKTYISNQLISQFLVFS